jgi:hypothetical protein
VADSSALVTAGEAAGWSFLGGRSSSLMDGSATKATDSSNTSRHVAGWADLPVGPFVTPVRTFWKQKEIVEQTPMKLKTESLYLINFYNLSFSV